MKRKEKLRQIAKEAKSVLWAVIAIIVFWIVAGFGVSKLHITIFHTPLWASQDASAHGYFPLLSLYI